MASGSFTVVLPPRIFRKRAQRAFFAEEKALELVRLYLHDNAAKLYGDMK
jgi:hypothetical protein